jgi:Diadenosine tetraphosphate (Ap4A) hydrolase and other HIT family hydrolases
MPDQVTQQPQADVDPDDYRDICSFCAEIRRAREHNLLLELMPDIDPADFILFETDNFVVVPGVGAVCDGYVVISPRSHVLSFGHLDESLDEEVVGLLQEVQGWLTAQYARPVLAFEHGAESFRNRGGSCTDHAHMHMFPADSSLDLVEVIRPTYSLRPVSQMLPAMREQVRQRYQPYLWLRGPAGDMWLCDAPAALSQYVRRVILGQLGRPDQWDWAVFPGIEHMRRTIERFHGGRL